MAAFESVQHITPVQPTTKMGGLRHDFSHAMMSSLSSGGEEESPSSNDEGSGSDQENVVEINQLPVSKVETNVSTSLGTRGDPQQVDFSSDTFRIYHFKVDDCPYDHEQSEWTDCPYAHNGEKAKRRCPRTYAYSCSACPDFRKGCCKRGDVCPFSHGVFECWLHPNRYRTQLCKETLGCHRQVCFFAHGPLELRTPPPGLGLGGAIDQGCESKGPSTLLNPAAAIRGSGSRPPPIKHKASEPTNFARSVPLPTPLEYQANGFNDLALLGSLTLGHDPLALGLVPPAFLSPLGLGFPPPSLTAFQPSMGRHMPFPTLTHNHSASTGDLNTAAAAMIGQPSFPDPTSILQALLLQQQQAIAALAAVNASGLQQLPPNPYATAALQAGSFTAPNPRPWSAGIPDPSHAHRVLKEHLHLQALLSPLSSLSLPLEAGSLPLPMPLPASVGPRLYQHAPGPSDSVGYSAGY